MGGGIERPSCQFGPCRQFMYNSGHWQGGGEVVNDPDWVGQFGSSQMPMLFAIFAVAAGVIGMVIGVSIGFCIGSVRKRVRQCTLLGAIGGGCGSFLFFVVACVVAYKLLPQKSVHNEWGTSSGPAPFGERIAEDVLLPIIFGTTFVGSICGSIGAAVLKKALNRRVQVAGRMLE